MYVIMLFTHTITCSTDSVYVKRESLVIYICNNAWFSVRRIPFLIYVIMLDPRGGLCGGLRLR